MIRTTTTYVCDCCGAEWTEQTRNLISIKLAFAGIWCREEGWCAECVASTRLKGEDRPRSIVEFARRVLAIHPPPSVEQMLNHDIYGTEKEKP